MESYRQSNFKKLNNKDSNHDRSVTDGRGNYLYLLAIAITDV